MKIENLHNSDGYDGNLFINVIFVIVRLEFELIIKRRVFRLMIQLTQKAKKLQSTETPIQTEN